MTPQRHRAVLVMDSRQLMRSVRNQSAPKGNWSRLYQAGPFYLDMSLRLEENSAQLLGHMVSHKAVSFGHGLVRLQRPSGEWLEKPLESNGRFSLVLEPHGDYSLEFVVGAESISLGHLNLS